MSLVACLLAALAAWLASGPGRNTMSRRLAVRPDASVDRARTPRGVAAALLVLAVVSAVAIGAAGIGSLVLVLAAAMAVVTVTRIVLLARADRLANRRAAEIADACGTLAALVRVGHVPSVALGLVADEYVVLKPAAAAQLLGSDVSAAMRDSGGRSGGEGLLSVARAWEVAGQTGAPLAEVLEVTAAGLREERQTGRLVSAELAAPRATGRLLAALPLAGIGMAYLLGGDPIAFLLTPVGSVCLLAAAALGCLGALWTDSLARSAGGARTSRV